MKHNAVQYTCRTAFTENAVRLMFKTEYFTYEKKLLMMRCGFAAVLLIAGMMPVLPTPARVFCLLVGVWLIVALDFPSKVRAEGVIQRQNGQVGQVDLAFTDREIQVEQRQVIPYSQVDRLVEDEAYFIIFQSKQTAVMVEKARLLPCDPEGFKAMIEEKTGKTFGKNTNLLSMNLFDLMGMVSSAGTPAKGKRGKKGKKR